MMLTNEDYIWITECHYSKETTFFYNNVYLVQFSQNVHTQQRSCFMCLHL